MTKFIHFNVVLPPQMNSKAMKKKFQSRTVAADTLSAAEVRALAQDYLNDKKDMVVSLNLGITFVSLADKYCKKTGRDEAVKRMKPTLIAVAGVTLTATHVFVHLEPVGGVQMNLRLNRASGFTTVTGELVGGQ